MKRLIVMALKSYKALVSPVLPPACGFYPTCSDYAAQAFEKHGVMRGGMLAVWRVLRCNPFNKGGVDPVP